MKLNPDCIRAILLYAEEHTNASDVCRFDLDSIPEELSEFSHEEMLYHLRQCDMNGFLVGFKETMDGSSFISDISPKAHEFLANIRKDTVWNGIKGVAAKVGSTSLSALVQISSNVITELIKAQFGLSGAASF